jgi:low temperature requirement protein LtrA
MAPAHGGFAIGTGGTKAGVVSATSAIGPARRLVRPPALRTGDPATASRLELFFDLAYVLVVIELAATFLGDLTWHGMATFTALFVALWFSWVGFTLYANRFDTDDVVFRFAKLTATLAVAGCAASASAATTSFSTEFAASFLLGRVVLLMLHVRAWRHVPEARPTVGVYLGATAFSTLAWAVSLGVDGSARWALWAAAVAVDAAGPVVATWRGDRAPLHMEHLPERFGLLVILVLGEAVGGAATGVHDAKWAGPSVAVGVAGFVAAAALWWNYFDITATHSEEELQDGEDEPDGGLTDGRHDLFVYGHLPLTLGVVMAGVGIEDLVLHPEAPLPSAGGWVLAGAVALYLVGSALILGGTRRTWRAVWPWPTAAVPLVLLVALPDHHSALLLVGGLAAVCGALALIGTLRGGPAPAR